MPSDLEQEAMELSEKVECYRMRRNDTLLCLNKSCKYYCRYSEEDLSYCAYNSLLYRARCMLAQFANYRRTLAHNIANVTIPDGVTEEQFMAVMANVAEALMHTDKGDSWPYDEPAIVEQTFSPD